jgi:hypothetical protein
MDQNTRLRVPKIAFIYGGSTSSATMIALQHYATLQLEYCALERNQGTYFIILLQRRDEINK